MGIWSFWKERQARLSSQRERQARYAAALDTVMQQATPAERRAQGYVHDPKRPDYYSSGAHYSDLDKRATDLIELLDSRQHASSTKKA
jgi:hypothetical protein